MKVLIDELTRLEPGIESWSVEKIAETLTGLGFETQIDSNDVLDVTFTPNRGDAMSALGLARELRAWRCRAYKKPEPVLTMTDTRLFDRLSESNTPSVNIDAKTLVPEYHAVVFEGISVGPSPKWLETAIRKLGWRPINAIVDLTNYLMDLYGQPLHAFDLDSVLGETMIIRESKDGELLTTLDDIKRKLPKGTLVIQDRDAIIDLAGIMGGQNSEINSKTTRVLLQAACFNHEHIRTITTAIGLRTQAAIRYERGVDPKIGQAVLNEAIRYLKRAEFGRAEAVTKVSLSNGEKTAVPVRVRADDVNSIIGTNVPIELQKTYLEILGCSVEENKGILDVAPPSWRFDISIWQDVAEEIVRLVGLNDGIKAIPLPKDASLTVERSLIEWSEGLKDRLVELGLNEVLTYSFTSKRLLDVFELPVVSEISNPLNPELKYLRPSLMPNLASVVAANPLFDPIAVFEVGHVFTRTSEEERLCICLASNSVDTEAWIVRFADAIGLDSAAVKSVAMTSDLTAEQRQMLKLRKNRAVLVEFRLADLQDARRIPKDYQVSSVPITYRPVSRYPAVTRDIAFVIPTVITAGEVEGFARTISPLIEAVNAFDEFQSNRFGENRKSLAFHVRYADSDRTLVEDEVNELHERLVSAIERTFNAERR